MSEEIVKVGNQDLSWLIEESEGDESLVALQKNRVLPRSKVIQGTTRSELLDRFPAGTCILMPGEAVVCKKNESFSFVPVFFYVEWGILSDRKDSDSPMFLAKTFDPDSEIAMKAQHKDTREEMYGAFKKRYVEIYNFPGLIYGDHDLAGTPLSVSFMKGEHGTGKAWSGAICLRKIQGHSTPLWTQVWKMTTTFHDPDEDRKWWGITPSNPEGEEALYIDASERETYRTHHLDFKKLYDNQQLEVDHSTGEDGGDATVREQAAENSEI